MASKQPTFTIGPHRIHEKLTVTYPVGIAVGDLLVYHREQRSPLLFRTRFGADQVLPTVNAALQETARVVEVGER